MGNSERFGNDWNSHGCSREPEASRVDPQIKWNDHHPLGGKHDSNKSAYFLNLLHISDEKYVLYKLYICDHAKSMQYMN